MMNHKMIQRSILLVHTMFKRGKEQKLNFMCVFHSLPIDGNYTYFHLTLSFSTDLRPMWVILIFSGAPIDVAVVYVGHLSLISVELRWELNDSFDFLHPGGKAGVVGGG